MEIKNILFPTDFSNESIKVREHAMYLGQELGAKIHVLHAIEPLDYEELDEEIKSFYRDLETQMEERMESERAIFEKNGLGINSMIVIGPRWRVVNTVAREKEIDLIVMGSHGVKRDGGEISVGTTSHRVMFTSPCPVLIVRYEEG